MATSAEKAEALAALEKVKTFISSTPVTDVPPPPPPPPDDHIPEHPDDEHHHPDDPGKHVEHAAMLKLVPTREATHFTDLDGKFRRLDNPTVVEVPGKDAKVWVPARRTYILDSVTADWKWVRVDGTLINARTRPTELRSVTVITTPPSSIDIEGDFTLTILDRGPRDHALDPLDLSGGFIRHGQTRIVGRKKEPWQYPSVVPQAGHGTLTFAAPPFGWQVGDELLVTGNDPDDHTQLYTEERKVLAVEGNVVRLNAPLSNSHHGGHDRFPGAMPVGNLTRSIKFVCPTGRAHSMQMHSSSSELGYIEYIGFGRTDAARIHTNVPGGDNQMGRYAEHMHIVTEADRSAPPMKVYGCVYNGSPKHGLVVHGAHAGAKGNIAYRTKGFGIFWENGIEVGPCDFNLAVECENNIGEVDDGRTQSPELSLITPTDFGAEGGGIWTQGGGVDVTDNVTVACGTGIEAFTRAIGGGNPDRISAANLRPHQRDAVTMGRDHALIHEVPILFARNTIFGGRQGISTWNLNLVDEPTVRVRSEIHDNLIIGVQIPIVGTYSRWVHVKGNNCEGTWHGHFSGPSTFPIKMNSESKSFLIEDNRFNHFDYPLTIPGLGENIVRRNYVNCDQGGIWVMPQTEKLHEPPRTYVIEEETMEWGPQTLKALAAGTPLIQE